MIYIIGNMNTLLQYQTAAQRRNVPIMIGIDGIQKVYGSNNTFVPPAFTTLIRNLGFTVCQSASLMKVNIKNIKINYIFQLFIIYLFPNRKY